MELVEVSGRDAAAALQRDADAAATQTAALPTRAQVDAALHGIECGRVAGRLSDTDGRLALFGHVPSDAARLSLRQALDGISGVGGVDDRHLVILPRPHCEVVEFLAASGLSASGDQASSWSDLGEASRAGLQRFRDGERMAIALKTPDFQAYLYVDYYDTGGQVYHLLAGGAADKRFAPEQTIELGGRHTPGIDLVAAPPYGTDIVVAIGSSEPLALGERPIVEPAAPYLEALQRATARLEARGSAWRQEYAYIFVVTEPR